MRHLIEWKSFFFPIFTTTNVYSYVVYIKNQKSHFYLSSALVRLTYTLQDFTGAICYTDD